MSELKTPEHKLAMMANQIADYFRSFPEGEAAAGVAQHIRQFWAPKMIRQFTAHADGAGCGELDALTRQAVALLKSPNDNDRP